MLKAIIVDDDRNVCQGLSKLIPWQKLGYELVGTASNGEDGYLLALEKEPDVIISDIVMPVVDGTDFLQQSGISREARWQALYLAYDISFAEPCIVIDRLLTDDDIEYSR